MAEFHFLRPEWLVLLPVAAWLAWRIGTGRGGTSGWLAVVDKSLQPYVLSEGENVSQRRWPLLAVLAAAVLATLALAGPAWDRLPVPAFRSDESLVVALDLSRSMDATDVEPTRLARARLKLLDLLDRRQEGQTALIVFTSNAFTVTPLTTDIQTIAALVGALSTDIMPSQGSQIEVGLAKAAELLTQAGAGRGEILLLTDAGASPRAFDLAESLRRDGVTTSVLAVGTEQGAPIPALGGGFLTDNRGQVVVPQVDFDNLQRLALAGGGRFAQMTAGDSDLDRLFPGEFTGGVSLAANEEEREAEIWRDQGIWFCLALLPLVALGFRRGWVYLLVAGIALPSNDALAFGWADLWLNPDQQGIRAFESEAPDRAASLFADPEWLAAARYRAGEYDASAAALSGIDTVSANYNRGNALARAGKLAEAIDAYDSVLEQMPDHADAEYNRELVAQLLEEQQQQEQQSESGEDQSEQSGDSESGGDEEQSGQQQASDDSSSDGEDEQQASNQQQEPGDEPNSESDTAEEGDESEPSDAEESADETEGQSLQASASPEDIEDWASEQAADQWLRRIPQDPGGLLRRKFLYQYQQFGLDQDGNRIMPGEAAEPW
jgi:Ca-activated chloride channel family protein